ncbi:type II 3-dehydroquinate dehydratase [Luteimonas aquatica]|uniref:type II 3-dehydroquinate dehydratase n=1 Tax=Luteimonas aquatica TaxID=450364 RepID=UPI001F5AD26D|nr:type II 3-dehydroquinate dehydratase [Luteimonas aquatica]
MSIVMIRMSEPQSPAQYDPALLPGILGGLQARAARAGRALRRYHCTCERELLERLERVREDGAEIVLLDPGAYSQAKPALRQALARLEVPYIEVHDDFVGQQEPVIAPRAGPVLAVVNGYGAQSYAEALSIALERIGCAECENDYHVGT